MNVKITPRAQDKLIGTEADELIVFQVRITTPFTAAEIQLLNDWGGLLLFDSGILAVVKLPARNLNELAKLPNVIEIS